MEKQRSKLILEFAGLACKISTNKAWLEYLQKRFEKSPFRIVKKWHGNPKTIATLYLYEKRPRGSELTFRFDYNLRTLNFYVWCTTSIFFFFPAISQALARIFSFLIFKNNGFILHASCVARNNQAYIFVGPSGSGKSTIARLSQYRYRVLSDNDAFILKKKDRFLAFPSPFIETMSWSDWRAKKSNGLAIKGLFLLKRSKDHKVAPLSLKRAIEIIKNNSELPASHEELFNAKEREIFQKLIFDFLIETRVYLLHFKKDYQFWKKIDENYRKDQNQKKS